MKDKPFALIGVNVNGYNAGQLQEAMRKEKLNWRSFADPGILGQGSIAARWNFATTPTYYLIDHKGVIRHKWMGSPGEKAMDAALDKLIQEAEKKGKKTPE